MIADSNQLPGPHSPALTPLPVPGNRVTLDSGGRIHLACRQTNEAEATALYGELKKILNHAGLATTCWTRG